MEYIPESELGNAATRVLCCECGSPIVPNPANMCVGCLRSQVDITEGIPKQATLHFCRGCERYHHPPSEWLHAALESRELLSLCLKKLKGLSRVKLIDAAFVWTEPHSKRIKVKLTVHGEVVGGAVLQQVFVVEYTIAHQMCDECHRTEAQEYWRASVQVRQKADNKKTFYYLEQLILKHKAHENTLGIKPVADGLDFFYATEAHARKMVDFLNTMLPIKCQNSKKLISHDIHSNTHNCKYSFSVDIVPISKDSAICLNKKMTQQLGGISPICLVNRVTNTLHLIDPTTAQMAEVSSTVYYRKPFLSVCDPKQLVEYIVMDIEPIPFHERKTFPGQGPVSLKHTLSDVWVVRASELGINDNTIHTRTHLGHILKVGDTALGYNILDSNINDPNFEALNRANVPDVILVKKMYDRSNRKRNRIWKLKHLADDDMAFNTDANDYDEFLDELEEDATLRQHVNIFKDSTKQIPIDEHDDIDPQNPGITLAEMLDDLCVDDIEMADN